MDDIKQQAVRGGFAKLCAQAVTFTLRLGSIVILARLLDPADFGLVAMVTALTGLLNLFRDFGLSTATVQRTTITEEQMSTLFWINVLVGFILTTAALFAAPMIATFYREPRLLWLTVVLGASFVFNAAGVQHAALLRRQMRFTTVAAIDVVSLLASVALGIGLALWHFGYWALAIMTLVSPLISSVLAWLAAGWIPALPSRQGGVRPLLRFGGTITLNMLVVYVSYNMEKVLLGRFWGADILGIYGRAYQLVSIPTGELNAAVGDVAISALSRLKYHEARLKTYFLNGYTLVLGFSLPLTIAFALFADETVLVVLGPKWSETAPILRLLAPTILIYAMINPLGWLLVSLGLVERSLKIGLVLAPLVIGGYLLGLPYGPKGVAMGYSAVLILWVVPHLAWCVHGTFISLRDILQVVSQPLLSAIVAAAIAGAVDSLFWASCSDLVRLLLGVGLLGGTYGAVLLYVMRQKPFYWALIRTLAASRRRTS